MNTMLAVLIFGVGYPLIALAVACAGTFGIAATRTERIEEAKRTQKYPTVVDHDGVWFRYRYREILWPLVWATIICSLLWPIGIPLWLAWKKGDFINQALVTRAELLKETSR
jgi:hypothetical protein